MTTTQSSIVKSNRAFMALEDMGAKLRFVSVIGRVHDRPMTAKVASLQAAADRFEQADRATA